MFTGLIKHTGMLEGISIRGSGGRLTIKCADLAGLLGRGDSLSVSGVCLTLAEERAGSFRFDVTSETLACTTLGKLAPGRELNLELPLEAGGKMGGHLVTGHVDGTGRVLSVLEKDSGKVMVFENIKAVRPYVFSKCSMAINGVSLTVASEERYSFEVAVIPETLKSTDMSFLRPGDVVNLEADTMVKAVVRSVDGGREGLTVGKLREAGF